MGKHCGQGAQYPRPLGNAQFFGPLRVKFKQGIH
jgi:hypothetical protein